MPRSGFSSWKLGLCSAATCAALDAAAVPIVFSAGGDATPASIQSTVDAFRAALGNPNNGNVPGPLAGGRREINWDGGGSTATTAPVTPFAAFQNTRGVLVTTPGTGLTQAPPAGAANDGLAGLFANPTYATTFAPFSALRLFTSVGSNTSDVTFFIPGSGGGAAAVVDGFGVVFSDIDTANTTRLDFFDSGHALLYSAFAAPGTVADASLSFLGVRFDAGEEIARVRITTGTAALGPNDLPGVGLDLVVMDDFLYSEPRQTTPVPEPATWCLLALGLGAMRATRRRRTRT